MSNLFLKAENLVKAYGNTRALDGVDISIYDGEIVGLIGENGSGKSTFSQIISGIQSKTSGTIFIRDEECNLTSAIDGQSKGIGMIVQEQGTVGGVSVAENIFLGNLHKFTKFGFINKKKIFSEANKCLQAIGMTDIDSSQPIESLDFQGRKLIEVAKVLYANPHLLIVDETTTALSLKGRNLLYEICHKQKAEGKTVLFISHDLSELMSVCDRLIVLRDGKKTAEIDKADFDEDLIKKNMVGREMVGNYYPDQTEDIIGNTVLTVEQISFDGLLDNCSFELRAGEILGIGGLSNSGMHELGKVIFGAQRPTKGRVVHNASGENVLNVQQAMKLGIGYVPKDRDQEALILQAPIKDNIAICGLDNFKDKMGNINRKKENKHVENLAKSLSIKCQDINQYVAYLSGGNKQKVVFAKWVGINSNILILDCPTRGVDVGVKAAMYELMDELRKQGKAIIMISEEMPELIGMSNRILIMKKGNIVKEITDRSGMNEQVLINHMI